MNAAQRGHQIATKAAGALAAEATAAGLTWRDIAVSCETVVAIVVVVCTRLAAPADPLRFAQELSDMITEAAHGRIVAELRARPEEERQDLPR